MITRAMTAVAAAAVTVLAGAGAATADPNRPPERILTWTCDDGTTFTTVRPSFSAAASPVLDSPSVWIQMQSTITFPDGEMVVLTWGGDAPGIQGSAKLLTCRTMSGANLVEVVGLLT